GARAEPGPPTQIDRAVEESGLLRGESPRQHRLEQKLRRAIAEIAEQRRLEARRILIEQRLHIALRHLVKLNGAEPHQPDGGAVAILGIGGASALERRDRLVALLQLLADFAERE